MKAEVAAEKASRLELIATRMKILKEELSALQYEYNAILSYFRVQKNRGKISEAEYKKLLLTTGKKPSHRHKVGCSARGEAPFGCSYIDDAGYKYRDNSSESVNDSRKESES